MATQDLAVRLKRKASPDDTDMGEGDASGVVVPSAQPNPRPVSDEPSKKRLRLDEELAALEDEAAEEGVLAEVTVSLLSLPSGYLAVSLTSV